jgi:hypothetical protein
MFAVARSALNTFVRSVLPSSFLLLLFSRFLRSFFGAGSCIDGVDACDGN